MLSRVVRPITTRLVKRRLRTRSGSSRRKKMTTIPGGEALWDKMSLSPDPRIISQKKITMIICSILLRSLNLIVKGEKLLPILIRIHRLMTFLKKLYY
jgi:hypothetical protein